MASLPPVYYATDSHRPPPVEFQSAIAQLALRTHPQWLTTMHCLAEAMNEAQVFDFGLIHDNKLVSESFRGLEFYGRDFLRMPFRSVIYWYNVTLDHDRVNSGIVDALLARYGDAEHILEARREDMRAGPPVHQRYATMAIDAQAWGLSTERTIVAADWIDTASDRTMAAHLPAAAAQSGHRKSFMLANVGFFTIDPSFEGKWRGNLIHPSNLPDELAAHAMGALGDGVIGLSMVLATRGIPTRLEAASPKLNAKRAHSGKTALVSVTHVDTRRYYEALDNTNQGGTHAHPVPHLRRGHLRYYTDARFSEAVRSKPKWIRDQIVNCRSLEEIGRRDHYEVET